MVDERLLHQPIWDESWKSEPQVWNINGDLVVAESEIAFTDGSFAERELTKRFSILFAKYGIDESSPAAWHRLSLRLAQNQYRGFWVLDPDRHRNRRHPGRRKGWTAYLLALLWSIVEEQRLKQKGTTRGLLRVIARKAPWSELLCAHNLTGEAFEEKVKLLNKQYLLASKRRFALTAKKHLASIPDGQRLEVVSRLLGDLRQIEARSKLPRNHMTAFEETTNKF